MGRGERPSHPRNQYFIVSLQTLGAEFPTEEGRSRALGGAFRTLGNLVADGTLYLLFCPLCGLSMPWAWGFPFHRDQINRITLDLVPFCDELHPIVDGRERSAADSRQPLVSPRYRAARLDSIVIPNRTCRVTPVALGVAAADQNSFVIPAQSAAHIGSAVTQRSARSGGASNCWLPSYAGAGRSGWKPRRP